MIRAVADTHTIIWYVYNDPKLSLAAKSFIEASFQDRDEIAVSGITPIEIIYLIEKGRLPLETFTRVTREFDSHESGFIEIPIRLNIARTLNKVLVHQVPDMPDRIIAATAVSLNVPIISRDGKIRLSGLQTVW